MNTLRSSVSAFVPKGAEALGDEEIPLSTKTGPPIVKKQKDLVSHSSDSRQSDSIDSRGSEVGSKVSRSSKQKLAMTRLKLKQLEEKQELANKQQELEVKMIERKFETEMARLEMKKETIVARTDVERCALESQCSDGDYEAERRAEQSPYAKTNP